eukprot:scaffold272838_cov28-Tisochrysis_lutea.AAC.1
MAWQNAASPASCCRHVDHGLGEALVPRLRALRRPVTLLHLEHRAGVLHEVDGTHECCDCDRDAAGEAEREEAEAAVRTTSRL